MLKNKVGSIRFKLKFYFEQTKQHKAFYVKKKKKKKYIHYKMNISQNKIKGYRNCMDIAENTGNNKSRAS